MPKVTETPFCSYTGRDSPTVDVGVLGNWVALTIGFDLNPEGWVELRLTERQLDALKDKLLRERKSG